MYDFQKNSLVDLHVHSNLSDGVYSPEELIELAIKRGIKALAITDHNCINPELFMHIGNCICKWLCMIKQLQS